MLSFAQELNPIPNKAIDAQIRRLESQLNWTEASGFNKTLM